MASTRAKRTIAITLVAAFTLMAFSPIFATAQAVPGHAKTGPYVDRIRFDVITQDDMQVLALQSDEIDIIGDFLDPSFIPALDVAENIELSSVLRNGYGFVTINTAKYPMNYTAFRRALAFSLDKNAISSEIFEGYSGSQDSPIPKQNGWSIEGQLPYTYYEQDIDTGKALLAAAGFYKPEGEDFLVGPNGPFEQIVVECGASSPIAIEVGAFISAALNDLDIDSTSIPTDFYEYLGRLNNHLDYDLCFLAWEPILDPDFLADEWGPGTADTPLQNFANWRNDTFNSHVDDLLHSLDYQTVYDAAIKMQEIWIYESPMIICYQNIKYHAFRTDKYEGHINDWADGTPGGWTNRKVHLKADQSGAPFGGTYRASNSLDLDTFNLMGATSSYAVRILDELYDSLMILDPDANDMLWLAESYLGETHADNDAVPEGHTRFTFQLLQNATWTDGNPLTAEDVAFSLNFLRDAPGNKYRGDLLEMSAAYAPSTYTVVVEFNTESYWHLHGVGFKPILPKHIMQDIVLEDWAEWSPNPPVEEMVTSGPFIVVERVAGEFTELEYNPDFFFAPDRTVETTTTTTTTTEPQPDLTMAIVAGAVGAAVVILVGGYVLMRQK